MLTEAASIDILSTLAGIVLLGLAILILFLEFRDLILSRRIKATVTQIKESPSTDPDGHASIDRFPEIEFIDPTGKQIRHELALTNITWKKPGDTVTIYYRPMKTDAGYKICSPFMWPKIIVLLFLTFGATLLLIGWGG